MNSFFTQGNKQEVTNFGKNMKSFRLAFMKPEIPYLLVYYCLQPTLKFLQYIAEHASEIDDSSWKLGHTVLEICRNLLIYHGTELYYTGNCLNLFYPNISDRLLFLRILISPLVRIGVQSTLDISKLVLGSSN